MCDDCVKDKARGHTRCVLHSKQMKPWWGKQWVVLARPCTSIHTSIHTHMPVLEVSRQYSGCGEYLSFPVCDGVGHVIATLVFFISTIKQEVSHLPLHGFQSNLIPKMLLQLLTAWLIPCST